MYYIKVKRRCGFETLFLSAAVACADVTSANVVGFQNQNATEFSAYTWMANTFKKVDGTTVKLGDFKLVDAHNPPVVSIYLLDPDGATLVKDGVRQVFRYVHPNKCTGTNQWLPGWYFEKIGETTVSAAEYKKGDASTYWAGNVEIPYGLGMGVMKTTELDARIVFSGAVSDSNAEVPITEFSSYTWTGNVMPVDLKFKNLSIKEAENPPVVSVYFLNQDGATLVKDGKRQVFRYVHPSKCTGTNQWLPGWYFEKIGETTVGAAEYKKGDKSTYWAGEVDFVAGQGVGVMKTTENDIHFVVPSPLVKAE